MAFVLCDNQENTIHMVRNSARFVGWIGNIRYYVLDGDCYSLALGGPIYRCDDKEESTKTINRVITLNY